MNLWAVTMVKDEIDIIEHTLRHLDSEGVDGIIVADNMSTDGTWEHINTLELDCHLHCVRDAEIGYYQSRKMTNLARQAFTGGADWVIPFDADELWYSTTGTLHEAVTAVQAMHNASLAYARLYNYYPTSNDDPDETNPYLRITNRSPVASELRKVAVRRGAVEIAQGNHDAIGRAPFIRATSTLEVAHFPWRSYEQFRRKVTNGYAAYQATDLPKEIGEHWRLYGRELEENGDDGLRSVYSKWYDPPITLEPDHAPYRTHRNWS